MSEKISYEISIEFKFSDQEVSSSIFNSVLPEHQTVPYERSKVTFNRDGSELLLTIKAQDLSALRGTVSSYLRWISTSRKLINNMEE